jgi:hypothetical protein
LVSLLILIPLTAPQSSSSIIQSWYNRANSGGYIKSAQFHSPKKKKLTIPWLTHCKWNIYKLQMVMKITLLFHTHSRHHNKLHSYVCDLGKLRAVAFSYFISVLQVCGGMQWNNWLRHYATCQKVVVSIPNEVNKFFTWPNPSNHTLALGSTQPPTEMSIRNLPGGKGQRARKADNFTTIREPTVLKMCEPRSLTTLWACMICDRGSFTSLPLPAMWGFDLKAF